MGGSLVGKLTVDGSLKLKKYQEDESIFISFDVVGLRQNKKLFVSEQTMNCCKRLWTSSSTSPLYLQVTFTC